MGLFIEEFKTSIGNPARTYIWEIVVPGLAISTFRAQSTEYPSAGSTDVELWYQGQKVLFAGAAEYSYNWACVLAEDDEGLVYKELYKWRQDCWKQEAATQVVPSAYKKDILIKCLKSTDGSPWLQARLHGAYPKTVDVVALDRSANTDAWKWSVTFNFDWWEKSE